RAMKPARFAYYRPESAAEALQVLAEFGDEAKVLAGGQSLVAAMNMRLARPERLVDINRIGQDGVWIEGDDLVVNTLTRQADVERDALVTERVPLLARALPFVGHWQTRSRGTVCGSLAHADPSAELPVVATALRASLRCVSTRGSRRVDADAFFLSHFTTALEPGELLAQIAFPLRRPREGYAFEEFAERHGDYAIASAACALRLRDDHSVEELRIVLGGVDERPFVVAADDVAGRALDDGAIETLAARAGSDIDPIGDLRGTADYRRNLATTLARRALRAASLDAHKERS
ncbi:MAG TPA: FAD binding domain-containing protein, partial [Candidatus Acidoferrum sp.]|nr:FAD binding domain-containing protein [Candidatus Acidoferrum sp.]